MTYYSLCGCLNRFIGFGIPQRRRVKLLVAFGNFVGSHYRQTPRCYEKAGEDPMWMAREALGNKLCDDMWQGDRADEPQEFKGLLG